MAFMRTCSGKVSFLQGGRCLLPQVWKPMPHRLLKQQIIAVRSYFLPPHKQVPISVFVFYEPFRFQSYKSLLYSRWNVLKCLQGGQYPFADCNRFWQKDAADCAETPSLHPHWPLRTGVSSLPKYLSGSWFFHSWSQICCLFLNTGFLCTALIPNITPSAR